MVFNSIPFALFLPTVFALYWSLGTGRRRAQNTLLFGASLFFYGWWDWRFLSIMLASTVTDYVVGLRMEASANEAARRRLLIVSLLVNLGFLGVFKYYNFFAESLVEACQRAVGVAPSLPRLAVILPVGISFYTFQTLSYSIDVYRRRLPASRDFVEFAAFVTFFPQLVAGPIERAGNLLPQFRSERRFEAAAASEGLRQMLWGLFKKVAIADTAALIVDPIFATPGEFSAGWLWLAAVLFGLQIYCDFSGYSDVAIGCARLFGIRLQQNFAYPYFSRDIAEFWRRWHISLSTWFRDYVYFPMGGSRGAALVTLRNVAVVFLISALWHGANWTFVVWGAIHAAMYVPLLLTRRNRTNIGTVAEGRAAPSPAEARGMLFTFTAVTIAWVFFRADSIGNAAEFVKGMFTPFGATASAPPLPEPHICVLLTLSVICLLSMEWVNRTARFALETLAWPSPVRTAFYVAATLIVLDCVRPTQFIYFQF